MSVSAILTVIMGFALISGCLLGRTAILAVPGAGFSKHKIRIKYLAIMLFFLFVGICVKDSYDISFYREVYNLRISHGKEPAFDAIQFFFHDMGVGFDQFKALWIAVITALLYRGIKQFSKKPEQATALMFLFGFFSFVTQMRSAMAMAILLNFIPRLYTGRTRDRVVYGLVVLVCGLMHISAYAFLLFLVINARRKRNYNKKYFVIVGLATLLAVGMNAFFINILASILGHIPGLAGISVRIIESVSGGGEPIKSTIFIICQQLFMYAITERACRLHIQQNAEDAVNYDVISEINTLSLIYLPLCILNASFTRLFMMISIIQFSVIMSVGNKKIGLSRHFSIDNISMRTALECFVLFVFFVTMHSNSDDLVRMINSIRF